MLVTCPECGGDISSNCDICPHCGYGPGTGGAGYNSPERKAQRRKWEEESQKENEKKAGRLAAEGKRRLKKEAEAEAIRKRRRDNLVMFLVLMGAVITIVFCIKYIVSG